MPELAGLAYLAASDDHRVWLEEAQDLLGCWHLLAFENPPYRLIDAPLDQRYEVLQALCKASGTGIGVLLKNLLDLHRLSAAGSGNSDQFPVGISQFLFGLLALAKGYAMELLRKTPDATVAGAEGLLAQALGDFGGQRFLRLPQQAAYDPDAIT